MVALPKSSGAVTLVESLVSCLQPPLPQPPSTTQPPSCLPLATMAKHGSRTHEVEPTLSQCQQDMLCPREILFPHLSLSPKVVPWHFQAPAISYSTSTLLLHFQRQSMKWIKGQICEAKIISSLGDSLPLPPCWYHSDHFTWRRKKNPAPGTSGCPSAYIHSPPWEVRIIRSCRGSGPSSPHLWSSAAEVSSGEERLAGPQKLLALLYIPKA